MCIWMNLWIDWLVHSCRRQRGRGDLGGQAHTMYAGLAGRRSGGSDLSSSTPGMDGFGPSSSGTPIHPVLTDSGPTIWGTDVRVEEVKRRFVEFLHRYIRPGESDPFYIRYLQQVFCIFPFHVCRSCFFSHFEA